MSALIAILALLTAAPTSHECGGCHGPARTKPASGHFATGLGRWGDRQCFGCHAEINGIAAEEAAGRRDKRFYAVPVAEARLKALATRPLSYMHAPERLEVPGTPRIDPASLGEFLRRPVSISATADPTPRMMAFPELTAAQLAEVGRWAGLRAKQVAARETSSGAGSEDRAAAEAIFAQRCQACHAAEHPKSGRSGPALALYTPQWLTAYASGKVSAPAGKHEMPELPLTLPEARQLHALFGAQRHELEARVDADVAALRLADVAEGPVPPAFVQYLWGRFFRDATCVHCHTSASRAAAKFVASGPGLAAYVERQGGEAFWRRLEIRAVEAQHGMGAAQPGMPMAGEALPAPLRAAVGRWVKAGCPDPDAHTHCAVPLAGG